MQRAPVGPRSFADMPVLIVDDNATNRRILRGICWIWGTRPVP